jgi:hypothetical protein
MRVFEIEVIVGTVDVPRNADNVFPANRASQVQPLWPVDTLGAAALNVMQSFALCTVP